MKTKSVDQILFEGHNTVLEVIEQELSIVDRIKNFLNREIEIPVTALALSCILVFSTMTIQWQNIEEAYPIVVFESGGRYEVY